MTPIKATEFTFTFVADGSVVAWSAGESQISKDGGAFINTTNLPVAVGFTGVYALTLTAAEMNANFIHVKLTDAAISDIHERFTTSGEVTGSVVTDGLNTASKFETDLSSAVNDYYKSKILQFTTGNLIGQVRQVVESNGSTKFLSMNEAFTGIPSGGDRFRLL